VDDDAPEFFAPVAHDVIDGLLGQYQSMRKRIESIADAIDGEMSAAVSFFLDGNKDHNRGVPDVKTLFQLDGAINALNSYYWSRAMDLTDVYSAMPQARRDQWQKQLTAWKDRGYKRGAKPEEDLADFTAEAVRPTINELLASRQKFFAERVDGIFRSLSNDHVTNSPSGFNRRMIIGGVTDNYSFTSSSRAGTINDLRSVIAKFMGRDELRWNSSQVMIAAARRNSGTWMNVDGGAMRIRVYMKGTAHLEIHPDMAYRLNQVLAHLYPAAIPSEFRTKPKKKHKEFQMMGRPLPFLIIEALGELRRERNSNKFNFGYGALDRSGIRTETARVLSAIGGIWAGGQFDPIEFDYDPRDVLDEIIVSGCIPDQKSHQFYPTPETVGAVAVEMAEIGENDTCCEPEAGQGDLAALLPKERTTCVEISPLHCTILKARGFNVVEADFIKWAETAMCFDRIVMNPPFSEGRAQAHVDAAAKIVMRGGRLTAILPASFKGKDILPGWSVEWSRVFDNEFAGTSVSVVIACGVRP
jgi:hypothetical protein